MCILVSLNNIYESLVTYYIYIYIYVYNILYMYMLYSLCLTNIILYIYRALMLLK